MVQSHYAGANPPNRKARVDVVRVTTSEQQQFLILSRSIFGQYIHWYGNRSHECTEGKKECNGCSRGWPKKFLGYLHVQQFNRETDAFLELTHTACEKLIAQAHPGKSLRGTQVRLGKTKGGAKGRYLVEVLERVVSDETLMPEKDPLLTLQFLWHCKNQHSQTDSES